jgi:hypothetical protein
MVLPRWWWLLNDLISGCWRLRWLWQFLELRQQWNLLNRLAFPFTKDLSAACDAMRPQNNCNSNIRDHWSHITITDIIIIITKFEILRELPKYDNRSKVSISSWKNKADRLALRRVATNLKFVKEKCQYLWSPIKRRTPVLWRNNKLVWHTIGFSDCFCYIDNEH